MPIFVGLVAITGIAAALMSWAVGANDVANALGTAVGSKALSLQGAIILGSIFEFLGCISMGGNVSSTISSSLVKTERYEDGGERMYMTGMFSALLGSAIWLIIATYLGMPVSTTHTIVSGVYMFGLMVEGWDGIIYDKLIEILLSWVLSPLLGCTIGFLIYFIVDRYIIRDPVPHAKARAYMPWLLGLSILGILQIIFIDIVMPAFGDEDQGKEWIYSLIALGFSIAFAIACKTFLFLPIIRVCSKFSANSEFPRLQAAEQSGRFSDFLNSMPSDSSASRPLKSGIEPSPLIRGTATEEGAFADMYFIPLQILTACFVGFAHGANDIANSIGPFAAIYAVSLNGDIEDAEKVEYWIIVYGAVFVVAGIAMYGHKVMATIGENVIALSCAKGFCVQLSTSWTVLLATYLGIPVSTTHCVVSSVIGVGLVEDRKNFNIQLIIAIISSWFLTIPAGAIFTMLTFFVMLGIDAIWIQAVAVKHYNYTQ